MSDSLFDLLENIMVIGGMGMIVGGTYVYSFPLALVVGGCFLIILAIMVGW